MSKCKKICIFCSVLSGKKNPFVSFDLSAMPRRYWVVVVPQIVIMFPQKKRFSKSINDSIKPIGLFSLCVVCWVESARRWRDVCTFLREVTTKYLCLCHSDGLKSQRKTNRRFSLFLIYRHGRTTLRRVRSVSIHSPHLPLMACVEQQAGALQTEAAAKRPCLIKPGFFQNGEPAHPECWKPPA